MFEGFEERRIDTGEVTIKARIGGSGPPLLLLHGYPQTHAMWHRVAPELASRHTVVCTDLRGYGDSDKPAGGEGHAAYAKRALAADQVAVMEALGFTRFAAAGHDRGGRVLHRLALDHPGRLSAAAVLDIVPTLTMFEATDQRTATAYYHWFFLIQPDGLPERLIGADPGYYLREKLRRWSHDPEAFAPDAVAEYLRCFCDPAAIHASCEDYRAAAGIDLDHDRADRDRRIDCPLLVLWGRHGFVHSRFDVAAEWRAKATDVRAETLDCGHFLPEEAAAGTTKALRAFFTP